MNLPDYFEPVDFSRFKPAPNPLGNYALGPAIEKSSEKISGETLSKLDVAFLGVPFDEGKPQKRGASTPDKIRQVLYRLAAFDKNLNIADLGNLKPATSQKGTFLALRDMVEYLREADVIPVILGGSQDLTLGICEAFKNNRYFSLSTVDAVLDIKKGVESFSSANYLTRLFKNLPNLFHFSLIGYQNHLVGENLISKTVGIGEHLRLGQLRDDISQAEFLLRNSDVLSFDMGAIKYSEAPATPQKNPNGLRSEEACQLARYAGLSPRLGVFGLFEAGGNGDNGMTCSLAAEITWYFLEGVSRRAPGGKRTVYKVEIEGLEHPVVFRYEQESERWWFEVQTVSGDILEVACSEKEYRQAADNEIPERWLKFVQKMDNLSK